MIDMMSAIGQIKNTKRKEIKNIQDLIDNLSKDTS
jgi:hypothetical protein